MIMEKLSSDNIQIPDRVWNYLEDFNKQENYRTIHKEYGATRLHALRVRQIVDLFQRAVDKDIHRGVWHLTKKV